MKRNTSDYGRTLAAKTGAITYNMTDDYMFRAVLQKNRKVLRGLIGALLHVDPQSPEFYATYLMKNIKNNTIYTDKLPLSVVKLNSIPLATREDRPYKLDKWAAFFQARTWEELKSMAATNQYMEAAANTVFELSSEENIRELCRRRGESEAFERHRNAEIAHLRELLARLQSD